MHNKRFPAEWEKQSFVQLTWPHAGTDWADMLDEVNKCFVEIAHAILRFENLVVICPDENEVKSLLGTFDTSKVKFVNVPTNDTWARDHGGITIFENDKPVVLDFTFNGWGLKFGSAHDNLITRRMFEQGDIFASKVERRNCLKFVLEGGSIESDGKGTILTTSECLLSENRNHLNIDETEEKLKEYLGAKNILWLHHGYLAGDDTDSHVDTLARMCPDDTICYVHCADEKDEHFDALHRMEQELKAFRTQAGEPYRLIALPMADAVYDEEGDRIPATYANFLIINGAVLVPVYGQTSKDAEALQQIQQAFPDREIIGIDCNALIQQHGSLHCVTMQYPAEVVNN